MNSSDFIVLFLPNALQEFNAYCYFLSNSYGTANPFHACFKNIVTEIISLRYVIPCARDTANFNSHAGEYSVARYAIG